MQSKIWFQQYNNITIEESNRDVALLVDSSHGTFLPPFEDLSHTSILYYCKLHVHLEYNDLKKYDDCVVLMNDYSPSSAPSASPMVPLVASANIGPRPIKVLQFNPEKIKSIQPH
jgi:hypothetical protein